MLNAPVICMHGMRTVVNKYGPAPNVLLIIPPVILWFVNYIQLLLHLIP
jgi:Na+/glutamate symporter